MGQTGARMAVDVMGRMGRRGQCCAGVGYEYCRIYGYIMGVDQ